MEEAGLALPEGVVDVEPMGYLDFLALMDRADLVLTDSGGMQEETSVLGVPCLTMRPGTERPITVELGTNRIVGIDPDTVADAADEALARSWEPARIPLWDGAAAPRIAAVMTAWADGGKGGEPGLCGGTAVSG